MEDSIFENVVKEMIIEDQMKCLACNVTAVNVPTWESHKKGKRHIKLINKFINERKKEQELSSTEIVSECRKEDEIKDNDSVNRPIGMASLDPLLEFMTGMEDLKPYISEKSVKRHEKMRAKQRKEDEKNKEVEKSQNRERDEEIDVINSKVAFLNLHVKPVGADGNCLYRSIAEQLSLSIPSMSLSSSYRILRRKVAAYLRDNADDFCCFIEDNISYNTYCDNVENSNEWGGEIELRALSYVYQRPIYIYSADADVIIMGEDMIGEPMYISYHKKYLSLGNHYNTLLPI